MTCSAAGILLCLLLVCGRAELGSILVGSRHRELNLIAGGSTRGQGSGVSGVQIDSFCSVLISPFLFAFLSTVLLHGVK